MFTEGQLQQLRELLSPIEKRLVSLEERMSGLEERMSGVEEGQLSLNLQFQAHVVLSQKQHDELVALIVDSSEASDKGYKETFRDHDKRITRVEKSLGLPH